ncbi:MAG: MarR family transcriptional regulator [Candidatus Woesearchaeota archaeon]
MRPEFELTETKWALLKELERGPLSPKELATLTDTSIANTSQQLKLLEAQGFLKRVKNKGVKAREIRDVRILYSISKPKILLTKISKDFVNRQEVKNVDDFFVNLLLCDLKELKHILKFFFDRSDLFDKIKCMFYLQTLSNEVHFLIITDELDFFRKDNHSFEVIYNNKKLIIKFWSHSFDELKKGLDSKEIYYVDLVKNATPLICDLEDVKKLISEHGR